MSEKMRAKIDFGTILCDKSMTGFYERLNETVVGLVRSLPRSVQSDAMFFMMQYGKISLGEPLDFFKNYYPPIWTLLYYLLERGSGISPDTAESAISSHALALQLHSLDDHLNDGEIPCSHLTLLLRGQAWHLMTASLEKITDNNRYKSEILHKFIDDYYSSITNSTKIDDLDTYCETFRLQMATVSAVPDLVMELSGIADREREDILSAFTSFGVAWRLLDDIHDLEEDLARGIESAVYLALPVEGQSLWTKSAETGETYIKEETLAYIVKTGAVTKITGRILDEMESAATAAEKRGLPAYGQELRELVQPIRAGYHEQKN